MHHITSFIQVVRVSQAYTPGANGGFWSATKRIEISLCCSSRGGSWYRLNSCQMDELAENLSLTIGSTYPYAGH